MKKFGVFDIEAKNWNEHLISGFYDIEYNQYIDFFTIKDLMNYIFSNQNDKDQIYAHFAGIYDSLFIIDNCFKNWRKYNIENMICSGRRILKLDVSNNIGRKISFIDSSGLLPFSLDYLTNAFGVENKKQKLDVSNLKKVTKKLRSYLKDDCIGLAQVLYKYFNEWPIKELDNIPLTRSGLAFKTFREFYFSGFTKLGRTVEAFSRQALYGGRTEIIRPQFEQYGKKLNVYDFTSLYPSVMRKYKFPHQFDSWTSHLELEKFSICDVLVKCPRNIKLPFLPCKLKGKLYFATGIFRGTYTNVELKYALSLGYIILRTYKCATFKCGGFMFRKYVDDIFSLRQQNKNNPVRNIMYKDLLNHLWGRIVMNNEREQLEIGLPSEGKTHSIYNLDNGKEIRMILKRKYIHSETCVSTGLFVPAYGRIELHKKANKYFKNLYYMDTDSLFLDKKIPSGDGLGQLKYEYSYHNQWYSFQAKNYAGLDQKDNVIFKAKGIRFKKGNSPFNDGIWSMSDYKESLSGNIKLQKIKQVRGLAGIRTGLKKGEVLHVLDDNFKGPNKRDEKRIWYFDNIWHTLPHVIDYDGENILVTKEKKP